jgi:hypothetical protein
MDFESLDLLGSPFEHVETYVYYDGRRTFTLRSLSWPDLYYFVNTVDEDEENDCVTTVVAAASRARFLAVRSGQVAFRAAFSEAHKQGLFVVEWTWSNVVESYVPQITPSPEGLPESWLPADGLHLDLETHTVRHFEPQYLLGVSAAQNRSVFAMRIQSDGARITEFPVRQMGELQMALDGELHALAREITGPGSSISKSLRPSVLELQAASFVVVMAIESPDALVEPTDVTAAMFKAVNQILLAAATGVGSNIIAELSIHSRSVRNRFRDMLAPLVAVKSGLSLSVVVAFSNEVVTTALSADRVANAARVIDEAPPEVSHVEIYRGVLLGLVLLTKRFDVASGVRYNGYMSDEAAHDANGFSVGDRSFVRARIRVEVPYGSEAEGRKRYFLESISAHPET